MTKAEDINQEFEGEYSGGGDKRAWLVLLAVLVVVALGAGLFFLLRQRGYLGGVRGSGVWETKVKSELVSLSDFKSLYELSNGQEGFVIVDLRGGSVWERGHIPGSIPFLLEYIDKFQNKERLDKYVTIGLVSDKVSDVTHSMSTMEGMNWQKDKEIYGLKVSVLEWQQAGCEWETFVDLP